MREVITGPALVEVMAHRMLSMDEVLIWAPEIAESLQELHRQERSHGGVAAGAVRIDGHRAVLMPGSEGLGAPKQTGDIVQFAVLLKAMLRRTVVATDEERVYWRALDRIAAANAEASDDSPMTMTEMMASVRSACPPQRIAAAPAESFEPAEEERPSVVPPPVRRVHARVLHVWAVLTTAAGLAVTACTIVVKFLR